VLSNQSQAVIEVGVEAILSIGGSNASELVNKLIMRGSPKTRLVSIKRIVGLRMRKQEISLLDN